MGSSNLNSQLNSVNHAIDVAKGRKPAVKKTKEDLQREANERRELREKQIAQLKASNQMLEDTKAGIIKRYGENSRQAKKVMSNVDVAIEQNIEKAKAFLGATEEDLNSAQYNEPDPGEVEAYNKRLEKLGITDEQMHDKTFNYGEVSASVEEEKSPLEKLKEKLNKLKNKGNKEEEDNTIHSDGLMSDEDFDKLVSQHNIEEKIDNLSEEEKNTARKNNELIEKATKASTYEDKKDEITDEVEGEVKEADVEYVSIKPTDYIDVNEDKSVDIKDFDPRDVPPEVMYDIIDLPSHGECYAHKKGKLPVAYLTAADENIIASPNLYNNGNLLDIILERKILDKSIRVKDLCIGDRDAIVVWLRATAYDSMFPVNARNPETGKIYKTKVDLSKLKYKPFNLKGDENGHFDYTTGNGDLIKFKMLSKSDHQKLVEYTLSKYGAINKRQLSIMTDDLRRYISDLDFYEGYDSAIEAVDVVKEWIETIKNDADVKPEEAYVNSVTNRMIAHTYSVNGETNPAYIKSYIENMRTKEAANYRKFIDDNIPGMNLKIKVNIPESDGGGSFETFLGIYDTIFLTL